MKAKELRIGNYLYSTVLKEEIQLDLKDFYFMYKTSGGVPSEWKPIPLTEEWLLKFGFEWYIPYDCFVKRFKAKEFIIRKDMVVCDMDFRPDITYVHQLQNLYFALTGEELTINK